MSFQQFPWVPDGIYDCRTRLVRYDILYGNPRRVIAKLWVDTGGPAELSGELTKPWGSHPDLPAKPAKS